MEKELLARLLETEDERVEWKESGRDAAEIFQAVCALANDLGATGRPGHLLIGVDKSGRVVGVPGDKAALDKHQVVLADRLHSNRILPTPSVDIQIVAHQGKTLLCIRVEPYPVPPVVEVNGVAWVRVGSTTGRATEADLVRLRERRPEHRLPFDCRVLAGADIEELETARLRMDYELARESNGLVETFPTFEAWLTQLELGKPDRGVWAPCVAAVLVHGRSPQTFLPGAVIEFARYGGADVSAPVTLRRTATGSLPDQLDAVWAVLAANLGELPEAPDGIRAPFAPEYPLEALKELARNMVQHRQFDATHAPGRIEWYDDRIEFSNPGRPFGRASEGEFGTNSDYRNPAITKLLARLGYVQRLGRGIRLARHLLAQNGNPPLEVETDGFTRVVVRRRS